MPTFRWRSPAHRSSTIVVLGLIALAAGGAAVVQLVDEVRFERRAIRLDGTVVGFHKVHRGRGGDAYAPIFRITPPGAASRDFVTRFASRPAAWKRGERSIVLFDPGDLSHAVADTVGQRWGSVLGFGIGGLVAAVGLVFALRS